jgi:uncharacterized Tic20 family protein
MIPISVEYLLFGVLLAVITTELEYPWWARKKNEELFHAIGFTSVVIVSFLLLLIDFKFSNAVGITIGFWNAFELYGNYRHGADLLYIGNTSKTDKFLREIGQKYQFDVKLFLHIFSIILFIITLIATTS